MAILAKRSGNEIVKDPLWALNWGTFGIFANQPMLGDVLAFVRQTADGKKAGHVALYIGEDDKAYHTLGGNQSDCILRYPHGQDSTTYTSKKAQLYNPPPNLRKIFLNQMVSSHKMKDKEKLQGTKGTRKAQAER
jgi:hypothetical protein